MGGCIFGGMGMGGRFWGGCRVMIGGMTKGKGGMGGGMGLRLGHGPKHG